MKRPLRTHERHGKVNLLAQVSFRGAVNDYMNQMIAFCWTVNISVSCLLPSFLLPLCLPSSFNKETLFCCVVSVDKETYPSYERLSQAQLLSRIKVNLPDTRLWISHPSCVHGNAWGLSSWSPGRNEGPTISNSIDYQIWSHVSHWNSSSKVMLLTVLQLMSHVWNRCQLISGDNCQSSDMIHISIYNQYLHVSVNETVLLRHCYDLTVLFIETAGSLCSSLDFLSMDLHDMCPEFCDTYTKYFMWCHRSLL